MTTGSLLMFYAVLLRSLRCSGHLLLAPISAELVNLAVTYSFSSYRGHSESYKDFSL